MLLGIKLLKMYGWEEMFSKAIEAVRKLEMSSIFRYNGYYGLSGKKYKHSLIIIVLESVVRVHLMVL